MQDDNTFSRKNVLTNYYMKIMKDGYNCNILVAISLHADLVWYLHTTLARKNNGVVRIDILAQQFGGTSPPCFKQLKHADILVDTSLHERAASAYEDDTPDRQQACNCLMNFYKSSPINHDNGVGLSGKFGLSITYTSPTTNCTKVN
nr:hypothetical protein [Tanacetum cinerariifolium]